MCLILGIAIIPAISFNIAYIHLSFIFAVCRLDCMLYELFQLVVLTRKPLYSSYCRRLTIGPPKALMHRALALAFTSKASLIIAYKLRCQPVKEGRSTDSYTLFSTGGWRCHRRSE